MRRWFLNDDLKVRKLPKYINAPLDMLAIQLFDLMVPLMLKVAKADGETSNKEREVIFEVLHYKWGYNAKYGEAALECLEGALGDYSSIDGFAANLAKFARTCPDIDENKFCDHLVQRLYAIARCGLMEHAEEIDTILRVQRSIDKQLSRTRVDLFKEWLGAIRIILNKMGDKITDGAWSGAARSFFANSETKVPKPRLNDLSWALRRGSSPNQDADKAL